MTGKSNDSDPRSGRHYKTSLLPSVENPMNSVDLLKFLYTEVCTSWRQLVEVRFKLLALLPVISGAGVIGLVASDELGSIIKLIICVFGFLITLALKIYDQRNSELYDDLISRGRKIEEELQIETGQFLGRKQSIHKFLFIKVQHDVALRIIYYSCLLLWIGVALFFLVQGKLNAY